MGYKSRHMLHDLSSDTMLRVHEYMMCKSPLHYVFKALFAYANMHELRIPMKLFSVFVMAARRSGWLVQV